MGSRPILEPVLGLKWNQMSEQKNQPQKHPMWIVRDADGKIFGPFTTQEILEQIDDEYFGGNEQVATYPGGRWLSISKTPEFDDRLLDALALDAKMSAKPGATHMVPQPGEKPE